jgi:mono/diheme cytochrome c family protein
MKTRQGRALLCGICIASIAAVSPAVGAAAGDPQRGRQLAELWCSSCHLVSEEQQAASTEAPPFKSIADGLSDDFSWLAAFIADPHPPMPQLSLTREEIRDLVAYIAGLRINETP